MTPWENSISHEFTDALATHMRSYLTKDVLTLKNEIAGNSGHISDDGYIMISSTIDLV